MSSESQPKVATHEMSIHFMDLLLDAVCAVDAEGRFVLASAACERGFGYTPGETIGRAMMAMVHPEDRPRTQKMAARGMAGQPVTHFENRYLRKDGQTVHIMWSARWSEADQLRIAVARDITDRKHVESMQAALYAISEAAHTTEDLSAQFREIPQIIGGLLPATNFYVALYDECRDELRFPYYVDEHEHAPVPLKLDSDPLLGEVIRTGQALLLAPETTTVAPASTEIALALHANYWLGVPLSSLYGTIGALVERSYTGAIRYTDKDKELLKFVSTQIAATIERKQMYARLENLAQYDQLTGLPNRELLQDRLRIALVKARRDNKPLCLLYLDLDKFKQENDSLGHAAGDLLLQIAAQRLKTCERESDTVGRIGGVEFIVLLERISYERDALVIADKIRIALNQTFTLGNQNLKISPSIGVALYPQHGSNEKELLNHADKAMY